MSINELRNFNWINVKWILNSKFLFRFSIFEIRILTLKNTFNSISINSIVTNLWHNFAVTAETTSLTAPEHRFQALTIKSESQAKQKQKQKAEASPDRIGDTGHIACLLSFDLFSLFSSFYFLFSSLFLFFSLLFSLFWSFSSFLLFLFFSFFSPLFCPFFFQRHICAQNKRFVNIAIASVIGVNCSITHNCKTVKLAKLRNCSVYILLFVT